MRTAPSPIRRLLLCSAFVALAVLPRPAAAAGTVGDLPTETLVSVIHGFVNECMKSLNGKGEFAGFYCPCAAAFIAERFTVDEMADPKVQTETGMEARHPGTMARLRSCAQAAIHRNDK